MAQKIRLNTQLENSATGGAVIVTDASGVPRYINGTAGQILYSNGAALPVFGASVTENLEQTLTAGASLSTDHDIDTQNNILKIVSNDGTGSGVFFPTSLTGTNTVRIGGYAAKGSNNVVIGASEVLDTTYGLNDSNDAGSILIGSRLNLSALGLTIDSVIIGNDNIAGSLNVTEAVVIGSKNLKVNSPRITGSSVVIGKENEIDLPGQEHIILIGSQLLADSNSTIRLHSVSSRGFHSVNQKAGVSTTSSFAPTTDFDVDGTEAIKISVGTTAQQPAAVSGFLRYDSTTDKLRAVDQGVWKDVFSAATVLDWQATLINGSTLTQNNTITNTGFDLIFNDGDFWAQGSGSNSIKFGPTTTSSGNNSLAIGNGASATATDSLAIGTSSFGKSTSAISIGKNAGNSTSGFAGITIGDNAGLNSAISQAGSVLIGVEAGEALTANSRTVLIGYQAGKNRGTVTNSSLTAIGNFAGATSSGSASGTNQTYIGANSGTDAVGNFLTAVGDTSLSASNGSDNTAVGYQAGITLIGNSNSILGRSAGGLLTGGENVCIGYNALSSSTTSGTVAIGYQAGNSTTTNRSIFIGYNSGNSGTANNCIFIGESTGNTNTTADRIIIRSNSAVNASALSFNGGTAWVIGGITPQATADSNLEIVGTSRLIVPIGTTAQQPSSIGGSIRYNSTVGNLYAVRGATWLPIEHTITRVSLSAASTRTETIGRHNILCNTTTSFTVTLPDATTSLAEYYIAKTNAANTLTIACNGAQTINGATTQVITAQYTAIHLISDGSNWIIY
jgi:hypothetical protein